MRSSGIVSNGRIVALILAVQHGEHPAEVLQNNFGGVLIGAGLVRPFARLNRALDVNLGALLQIALRNVSERAEDYDPMPLGLFFLPRRTTRSVSYYAFFK